MRKVPATGANEAGWQRCRVSTAQPEVPGLLQRDRQRQPLLLAELVQPSPEMRLAESPEQRNLERLLHSLLQPEPDERAKASSEDDVTSRPLSGASRRPKSPKTRTSGRPPMCHSDRLVAELSSHLEARNWKQVRKTIHRNVLSLSQTQNGSKQLQELLKSGNSIKCEGSSKDWNAAIDLVLAEMQSHVMEALQDGYSNYVLQTVIQALSPERFKFILEELKNDVTRVAMDAKGCRVMQRIIEHVGDKNEHTMELLTQILPRLQEVAMDRYGNHVVQKFLEMASQHQRDLIAAELLRLSSANQHTLLQMANSKYGSHVLEKAMANASQELQVEFLELLEAVLDRTFEHRKLKKTKFGSFVYRSYSRVRAQWDGSPKAASSSSSCPSPAPYTPRPCSWNGFVMHGGPARNFPTTPAAVMWGTAPPPSWCPVLVPFVPQAGPPCGDPAAWR
mmetsp:Transcript_60390/g.141168  ORF Transcript_60390/g.141168 Transcript_60390/m.141168 type:complete len:449 (+) Transcript_60390:64-1410(+)